jgi:hypothetical protein
LADVVFHLLTLGYTFIERARTWDSYESSSCLDGGHLLLKITGWAVLAGALTVFLYSALGILRLASFSAGPNYPHELAMYRFKQWLTAMGISMLVALFAATFLWIKRNRPTDTTVPALPGAKLVPQHHD